MYLSPHFTFTRFNSNRSRSENSLLYLLFHGAALGSVFSVVNPLPMFVFSGKGSEHKAG